MTGHVDVCSKYILVVEDLLEEFSLPYEVHIFADALKGLMTQVPYELEKLAHRGEIHL